jgi:hypothetical protein
MPAHTPTRRPHAQGDDPCSRDPSLKADVSHPEITAGCGLGCDFVQGELHPWLYEGHFPPNSSSALPF